MTVAGRPRRAPARHAEPLNCYETIVLCQPDAGKSCSACCGLFNLRDISRDYLSRFLGEGAARSAACIETGDIRDQGDTRAIRDITSYICPHQGLIFNRRPGCLLHPQYRSSTMRESSFFGEKICSGFLCPAHSVLSAAHKKTIIGLVDDWYAYSIAVIDPWFTAWLLGMLPDRYPPLSGRDDIMTQVLHACLMLHAEHLASREGPVFFYSVSECTAAGCDGPPSEGEQGEMEAMIRELL